LHVFVQLIEKCRATMQTQFDQWYANLHARNGMLALGAAANTHSSAYVGGGGGGGTAANMRVSSDSSLSNSMSTMDRSNSMHLGTANSSIDTANINDGLYQAQTKRGVGSAVPALNFEAKNNNYMDSKPSSTGAGAVGGGGADAKGATGGVEEDIMAFYQAKEELLKRRGPTGGGTR
jgi:hypothetical protein